MGGDNGMRFSGTRDKVRRHEQYNGTRHVVSGIYMPPPKSLDDRILLRQIRSRAHFLLGLFGLPN